MSDAATLKERFGGLDRWGRLRLATLVGWLVLSAASVGLAMTGDGESNPLDADVQVIDTGFGTALRVENRGDDLWKDLVLVLRPGEWVYRKPTLRPGQRLTLQVSDFARPGEKGSDAHPDREFRPSQITVRTADAAHTLRPGRR